MLCCYTHNTAQQQTILFLFGNFIKEPGAWDAAFVAFLWVFYFGQCTHVVVHGDDFLCVFEGQPVALVRPHSTTTCHFNESEHDRARRSLQVGLITML